MLPKSADICSPQGRHIVAERTTNWQTLLISDVVMSHGLHIHGIAAYPKISHVEHGLFLASNYWFWFWIWKELMTILDIDFDFEKMFWNSWFWILILKFLQSIFIFDIDFDIQSYNIEIDSWYWYMECHSWFWILILKLCIINIDFDSWFWNGPVVSINQPGIARCRPMHT